MKIFTFLHLKIKLFSFKKAKKEKCAPCREYITFFTRLSIPNERGPPRNENSGRKATQPAWIFEKIKMRVSWNIFNFSPSLEILPMVSPLEVKIPRHFSCVCGSSKHANTWLFCFSSHDIYFSQVFLHNYLSLEKMFENLKRLTKR